MYVADNVGNDNGGDDDDSDYDLQLAKLGDEIVISPINDGASGDGDYEVEEGGKGEAWENYA